jgi:hypothetical protein
MTTAELLAFIETHTFSHAAWADSLTIYRMLFPVAWAMLKREAVILDEIDNLNGLS